MLVCARALFAVDGASPEQCSCPAIFIDAVDPERPTVLRTRASSFESVRLRRIRFIYVNGRNCFWERLRILNRQLDPKAHQFRSPGSPNK